MNPTMQANYALGQIGGAAGVQTAPRTDVTLRENLEAQIQRAEEQVKRLKEARDRLEKSGVLDSRIDDLQMSMNVYL